MDESFALDRTGRTCSVLVASEILGTWAWNLSNGGYGALVALFWASLDLCARPRLVGVGRSQVKLGGFLWVLLGALGSFWWSRCGQDAVRGGWERFRNKLSGG